MLKWSLPGKSMAIVMPGLRFIFMIMISLATNCGNPETSIVVMNPNTGKILVNGGSVREFIIDRSGNASGDSLYFLDLPRGKHVFVFVVSDSMIEKHVHVGGETYLSVDLSSGETFGFD